MLLLEAIRHTTFGVNRRYPPFAGLTDLFEERSTPYRVPVLPAGEVTGNRNSISRMAEDVLAELAGSRQPDLVVVAHALPDCDLAVSVAGHLEHHLPGQPLVFAVSDQGRTTPFAALQAAHGMSLTGRHRRLAVVVVDQGTIVYQDPVLAGLDLDTDHAVGLLFDADGPIRVGRSRQVTGVTEDRAAAVVADELAELPGATLVCGAAVPVVPVGNGGHRVRRAAATQLCTAVWSVLADELAAPCGPRTVLAVEYEPELEYLGLATFEVPR